MDVELAIYHEHTTVVFCSRVHLLIVLIPHRPGSRSAASIILRGANDFMVDEMERSVHDALCVVKRVLESNQVVPGGGAVEAALSIYLETFATSIVSEMYICRLLPFQHQCKLQCYQLCKSLNVSFSFSVCISTVLE